MCIRDRETGGWTSKILETCLHTRGVAKSTKLSVTRYMFTKHSPNLHKTYVKLTKNLYKTAVNKMVLLEVASIASVYTLTYFCLLGLTPNPVIRWWQCQGATASIRQTSAGIENQTIKMIV